MTKPAKRKERRFRRWVVLSKHGELGAWGNGKQFQAPVFEQRKEAQSWLMTDDWMKRDMRIQRATLIVDAEKGGRS